jgi:putative polyketide hydroxylase
LFEAPLWRVLGERRHGIYVITEPESAGVFVPTGPADRWVYGQEWAPGRPRPEGYTRERLVELIRKGSGVPDLEPRILTTGTFSFAAQVAERYRQGRVFLAGDAAHRITPRGGTGMNTAIHDAYDLGWKLAWVLNGWAGPGLLDRYEQERRPIGLRNTARSADPDGSRREIQEALPADLNGRMPHAWVWPGVSTLDLLGPGFTVLTGPEGPAWRQAAGESGSTAPIGVQPIGREAADVVGIGDRGAVLVRPDAQVAARWYGMPDDPGAALRDAIANLIGVASHV